MRLSDAPIRGENCITRSAIGIPGRAAGSTARRAAWREPGDAPPGNAITARALQRASAAPTDRAGRLAAVAVYTGSTGQRRSGGRLPPVLAPAPDRPEG